MILNNLAQQHFQWIEDMNWHNKKPLESVSLIFSEIGEAADEIIDVFHQEKFAEEVTDIVLRTLDLCITHHINIDEERVYFPFNSIEKDKKTLLLMLLIQLSKTTNTMRKETLENDFKENLLYFLNQIIYLSEISNFDLEDELMKKIAKNLTRGSRGRLV